MNPFAIATLFSAMLVLIALSTSQATSIEGCNLDTCESGCFYPLPTATSGGEVDVSICPDPTAELNLPIQELRAGFQPYTDFCHRNPGQCDLSGENVISLSAAATARMLAVNAKVNQEIHCISDSIVHNVEEYWS